MSEQEKQYILDHYLTQTGTQIAEKLGRPTKWIYNATRDLGLIKTSQQKSQSRKTGAKKRSVSVTTFTPVIDPGWAPPNNNIAEPTRFRVFARLRGEM